jgi:protein involved in ribonucleotide reduction
MSLANQNKIQQYNATIAYHAQPIFAKLGFPFSCNLNVPVTKEDMEHLIEIIKSASKRNIENNPFLTEQQKEEQQHQIDVQLETIKQLSGIASV